jgi:hypothetical protein
MIENNHAWLSLGPINEFTFAFEAIQNFPPVGRDDEFGFDLADFERPPYKEDVILVVFAEEDPAVMWHMVKVQAACCELLLENVPGRCEKAAAALRNEGEREPRGATYTVTGKPQSSQPTDKFK